MMATKRLLTGVIAASATIALAACGSTTSTSTTTGGSTGASPGATSGFDAASNNIVNPSTTQGGTINLVSDQDCDSWDPASTYYGFCWNLQRLISRPLMAYKKVNGNSYTVAPDLATGPGKHNANDTEWTYTLKTGVKWQNGKPVTPQDVKYAVERLYTSGIGDLGPGFYLTNELKAPKGYAGPYKSGDLPDSSISIKGQSITFHLDKPFGDMDYFMALPAAAPVPDKTEGGPGFTGTNYTKHVMSDGPFMIKSYKPNASIDFVRNPDWSQSTDDIRHPLANEIDVTIDTNSDDADQKLKDGTYDASAHSPVGTTFQAQLLTDSSLKENADDPASAFEYYMSIIPSVIPNKYCREAVEYATNKASILQVLGGPYAGEVANSATPPGIDGYDTSINPFPPGSDNTGDLNAAKAALAKCGKPNGFTTKIAYRTTPSSWKKWAVTEQAALARVGIKADLVGGSADSYFNTFIGSPANLKNQGLGITLNDWGADYPKPYGYWFFIADGAAIRPTGNYNTASMNDPVVNGILDKELAGTATSADYTKLNQQISGSTTFMPVIFAKNLYYRNPRLTNVTSNNAEAMGVYDFVNMGVSQ